LTPEVKAKFTEKRGSDPKQLSGRKVLSVVRIDGLKLVLDVGSWGCYRLSGTEPVERVYSEARSEPDLEKLSAAAKNEFSSKKFAPIFDQVPDQVPAPRRRPARHGRARPAS
jgi:phosphomannomutase